MQQAISHLNASDAIIAAIIQRAGPFAMQYRELDFSALARAIVFQQLSGKSARPIYARLEAACGGAVTPEAILKLRAPTLRKVGLSRQKSSYLRDLAHRSVTGEINFAAMHEMSDEEVVVTLTQVKGIGTWTAHMFLIFALRRPNVLPTGDYGVRAAIQRAYKKRKLPTPKQVEILARKNNWHPYCSVAAWYLWRSIDGGGA